MKNATLGSLIRLLPTVALAITGLIACQQSHARDLADQAHDVLKQKCYRCHGQKSNGSGQLDVSNVKSMVELGYVTPGDLDDSYLWDRIESGDMPPQSDGLTPQESETIREWIQGGAKAAKATERTPVNSSDVILAIHSDLMEARSENRRYYRYFTLTNLHNNPQSVRDADLPVFRAALSKMLNSLSRSPDIYLPVAIDTQQTIFRIDLRELSWDASQWNEILSHYPYGLNYHHGEDRKLADRDRQIDQMTETSLCWIRADWFISKASRSPLYENLLRLPNNLRELEGSLGVDPVKNFNNNTVQRAGFTTSGVSTGHRILERHRARDGYYWKSFDFQTSGVNRDAIRFPLGPKQAGSDFNRFAFQHDGGEIIFSLPNGLQGYMLVDAQGKSIEKAPIEIVRDVEEIGGTPQVINAVSCIHCHHDGIISFRDAVREGSGLFGQARVKTLQIYPEQSVMNRVVERDRDTFRRANTEATAPFLAGLNGKNKTREPVGSLVRFYDRDLSRTDVAAELGIAPNELRLGRNEIRLGLDPLNHGLRIKRKRWESLDMYVSPFQQTLQSLGLATPVR